ncbi:MAG: Clp protease N-terminal domain-containing protein [Aggregatilineales bacterium]
MNRNTGTLSRFTRTAAQSLSHARAAAEREQTAVIAPIHLLAGLAALPANTMAGHVLSGHGIYPDRFQPSSDAGGTEKSPLDLSVDVKRILERAAAIALERNEPSISSAHLLAGLLSNPNAAEALTALGSAPEQLGQALNSLADWTSEP